MTFKDLCILKSDEVEVLRKSARPGETHPVVAITLGESWGEVSSDTQTAASQVMQKNAGWLRALKPRLLDVKDFTSASSALGEIRAYGALIEAWMSVTPRPHVQGKNVRPEFEVDAGDGPVIVEVHSRQLDRRQAKAISEHHAALNAKHQEAVAEAPRNSSRKNVVTTGVHEVTPFGEPEAGKAGDSVLANTINRIAAIKETETQVDPEKPFVLWLDMQDPTVWPLPIPEQVAPVYTAGKDGYVDHGGLWFGLYGCKGDPMIVTTPGYTYRRSEMLHDGRFAQTMKKGHRGPTRVSAVVYSLAGMTILMEHPSPVRALPSKFRASLLRIPRFCLERSYCDWQPGLVRERIAVEKKAIAAAAATLFAFDPCE